MTPHDAWRSWDWQPLTVGGLVAVAWAYGRGVRSLWDRRPGRGVRRWQAVCFFAGLVWLFVALVSPLHAMSGSLLSAHMAQHLLLIAVAPPLLVLGAPALVIGAALPESWRTTGRRMGRWRVLRSLGRAFGNPVASWLLALVALWGWHAPSLYQAAVRHEWVHALEHITFVATALLFWWTALQPTGVRRLARGLDVLYVFTGSFQGAALGFLFAFASAPLYPVYSATAPAWGLTAIQDQQLAGVIMWLPSGLIYLVAAGWLFLQWLQAIERATRRLEGRGAAVEPASASGFEPVAE